MLSRQSWKKIRSRSSCERDSKLSDDVTSQLSRGERGHLSSRGSSGRFHLYETEILGEETRIQSIAARALPLWDRQCCDTQIELQNSRVSRNRLRRWRAILGSSQLLNRRLRGCSFSRRTLEILLNGSQIEVAYPSWVTTLASTLRLYPPSHEADLKEPFDPSFFTPALPFQEVFVGFIRHARERLKAEAGAALQVLCPSAMTELERQLVAHLTFVASRTIGRNFYEFRFAQAPAAAIESVWCRRGTSTEIYTAYVQHMYNGGLVELLDTYPVLGRLLSQSLEQWVRASSNLCCNFLDDFFQLREFFGWRIEQPEQALAHVRTDLSDRHHGGQTVTECTLRTSERVLYKPRTVQPEISFFRFVDWLNGCGLSLDLKVIRGVDCGSHGWVEFVPCKECSSNAEVKRFYVRCGMVLAILHALAITDVHSENLIASGEWPVVVDLETLLNASAFESQTDETGTGESGLSLTPSVLNSGFLPRWQTSSDGHFFDMSALGGDDIQNPGIQLPGWERTNTDQMAFVTTKKVATRMSHRVQLDGRWPSALEHLPSILEGFREVYSCLLIHQRALLLDNRLMDAFDQLELRVLVRNSATYAELHFHLLHPDLLRDGIDRSLELEWLARPLSATVIPQKGRIQLYEIERAAMENLDIPHFSTSVWRTLEHSPEDTDLSILGVERDSQALRVRLASLSQDDCIKQLNIIEDAVRSRFV